MNIALIIYGSMDTISGGYLYDRKLVEYLRNSGHQVDILSLPWRNYARHLLDNFSDRMYHRIRQGQYNVVLQDELNHPSLIRLNARLKGRLPLISIVHHLRVSEVHSSIGILSKLYRKIEWRYLNSVNAMLFTSRATADTVKDFAGLPRLWHIAYPAASHLNSGVNSAKTHAEIPRVLFVGNVIKRKGVKTILQSFVKLKNCRLTIAGQNSVEQAYTDELHQFIRINNLDDRVQFIGPVSAEELIRLYKSHDIFAMPSEHEGFGIVYLEAMSFALPVIASSAGGAKNIVLHGENGFLVDPGNSKQISQAIKELSDPETFTRISGNALRTYRKHPDWKSSMAGAERFINKIVAEWSGYEK